ncbi:Dam family site-specific DNA-(adenine-N6)-methyltransferase [Euryarchaeota archaeon]|nr:Dam family site-specific DNA-(adenine-N6)-methyltransferase [Euryarchaeota archaeon]
MGDIRPFLKWAGGKHRVAEKLIQITEKEMVNGIFWSINQGERYYEPFLGSGAMYFALKNNKTINTKKQSYLSDLNYILINCMNVVKDKEMLEELILELLDWQEEYGRCGPVEKNSSKEVREESMYYRKRKELNNYLKNKDTEDFKRGRRFASLMIFLNKTCFNGLWRMNRKGEFNVPEGDYIKPKNICQENILRSCNSSLKNSKIRCLDWKDAIKGCERGDLVYFDPPYMPLKIGDNVFTSYFTEGFSFDDQKELAEESAKLASKGVRVIASNHDTDGYPNVRQIYTDAAKKYNCKLTFKQIEVSRNISCKGHGRVKVNEILIFLSE